MSSDADRVKSLFLAAVEKYPPSQWVAYLDEACAGDPATRREVEALLRAHAGPDSLFDRTAPGLVSTADAEPVGEGAGTLVGPYRILEPLGEGGMGLVFVAEQQEPVRRKVALKVIKPGMDTRHVIARFEAERQALALMDHPNIAKVLDGGETAGGRPYFVMELVRGVPITAFCDERRLTPRQRLELFLPTCAAVQHAHTKGVIHRDIKPSNVLAAVHDGAAVVKVIDFGIAKAVGQPLTDKTIHTQLGQLVGTPLYASPEQAGDAGPDVDTRSDVYSLGVLLYELLTGTTPFDPDRFGRGGHDDIRRVIREEEAPKPSARVGALGQDATLVASRRQSDPRRLSRQCRGELDWIVMRCLEKDRNRRYETASGLALDVQRYLRDEPVQAGPPSAAYRLGKLARRHRVGVAVTAVVLFTLVAGMVGTTLGLLQARQAEGNAVHESEEKQRALNGLEAEQARTKAALKDATEGRGRARVALDQMSSRIIDEWLSRQPELTREQKQFLEFALTRYEEFTRESGNTPEQRQALARAYWRVGMIRDRLGLRAESAAALEQAVALLKALRQEDPDKPEYADDLARTLNNYGILQKAQDRVAEAVGSFEAARELWEMLREKDPRSVHYAVALGGLYCNLGSASEDPSGFADRLKWCDKAIATLEPFRRDPLPGARLNLAAAHHGRAVALVMLSRRQEAIPSYRAACDLMEELHQEHPDVPRYAESLATMLQNRADEEDDEGALASHLAARQVLERLVEDYPSVPALTEALVRAHHALSFLQLRHGQRQEALRSREAVCRLQEKLVRLHPDRLDYQVDLAGSETKWGEFLAGGRDWEAAIARYETAIARLEPLLDRKPEPDQARAVLAHSHLALGGVLEKTGHADQAVEHYRKAVAVRPDFQEAYFDLGNALRKKADADDAIAAFRQAVALGERQVQDHPQAPEPHSKTGMALNNLAVRLMEQDKLTEARELLEQAIQHQEAALGADRKNPDYRENLRNHCWSLAATLVRLGDHAGAARAATRLPEILPDGREEYLRAAIFLAMCVPLAEKDAQLPEDKRKDLAREYGDRAAALVRQAVARGYRDRKGLEKNSVWEPIRSHDDFRKALQELDEARPKEPGDRY
jgi:serine/threonine protein kinase/tetratricopeptide (TPR) repeat protein